MNDNLMPTYTNFILSYKNKNTYTEALMYLNYVVEQISKNNNNIPFVAVLNDSITNACNGKCIYCCANSGNADSNNIDLSNAFNRLVEISPPIIFSITGGEPLLYPEKCLNYFKIFGGKSVLSLLSNLSLPISENIESIFVYMSENKWSFIQTSIDSLYKPNHNLLRYKTDLDMIVSNIDYIKRKFPNIKLKLNCTVSDINYHDLYNVVDFAIEHGIESLHFNTVLPFGRAEKYSSIDGLFKIIKALIEISNYDNYFNIKEHTISFPNELIQIGAIESGEEFLKKLSLLNRKYESKRFTLHIDENSGTMDVGWGASISKSISNDALNVFYELNKKQSYYCSECKNCSLLSVCNPESLYFKKCLISSLKEKIECILSSRNKPAKFEKNINKLSEFISSTQYFGNITIYTTRNCNGNCYFCQVNGNRENNNDLFPIEKLIDFIKDKKCLITITGGEPLVDIRRIEKMIIDLKNKGNIITLLTNGVLYDKEFLYNIKKYFTSLDIIQISIYSNDPEIHRKISGRDDWDLLNRCIVDFVETGINVRLNLTMTPLNVSHLLDIVRHYKKLGVEQICINGLLRKGKATNMYDMEYVIKVIESLYELCKSDNDGYSFVVPVEVLRVYSNILSIFKQDKNDNLFKNENLIFEKKLSHLYVNYNGEVYIDTINKKIGNINTIDLEYAINKYNNIVINRNLENTRCRNCLAFSLCKSECYLEEIYTEFHDFNHSCCDVDVQRRIFKNIFTS